MDTAWVLGEDLVMDDNILDGITFEEVVDTVRCNARFVNRAAVREALKYILECRVQDYNYLLEKNIDEIVKAAKKGKNNG